MPKLVKLYIQQCLIGFGISAVFLAILLWFNVANLWHLVSHDKMGWLALLMIWIFNGSVFGAVQFAISVMRMKDDEWEAVINTNLSSVYRLSKGVLRGMMKDAA